MGACSSVCAFEGNKEVIVYKGTEREGDMRTDFENGRLLVSVVELIEVYRFRKGGGEKHKPAEQLRRNEKLSLSYIYA